VPAATGFRLPSGKVMETELLIGVIFQTITQVRAGGFSVSYSEAGRRRHPGEAILNPTSTLGPEGTSPEAVLVESARQGDLEAFSQLINRYERKIFRLARNITQNDEDAEDVLQETFLKAFSHLDGFQGQSKFYTWIVRIAVNEALMKLRKRKSDRTVSLDESIESDEEQPIVREIAVWDNPEQQYTQAEMREILDKAINSLKPIFRVVFVLRDIDELSTEETAETLGLSVAAVKSRLLRARLELREKLTRTFKRKGDQILGYV
jgi:RNA polymerase sigma-70 factor (ECF subfamily)